MSSRGPIPRPATAEKRSGRGPTPKRRGPVVAVDPTAGPPAAPDELGPRGREAWAVFWTASWLIPADEPGIRILCQIIDALDAMDEEIGRDGRIGTGSKGQPVAHPLLAPANALRSTFLAWVGDFGFSPMSRARLRIEVVPRREPSLLGKYQPDPYGHLRPDVT